MTENEKRLRESLGPSMLHHLEMLLAEKAEEKRSARTEALKEAAQQADGGPLCVRGVLMQPSERIHALITTPAPASIPVERVRVVLLEIRRDAGAPENLGITSTRASGRMDAVDLALKRLGIAPHSDMETP